jgi:hypothetical protein
MVRTDSEGEVLSDTGLEAPTTDGRMIYSKLVAASIGTSSRKSYQCS